MGKKARRLESAIGEVEESILPALSDLIDGLLDSAALARPGTDADQHATELRYAACQMTGLTRLLEAVAPLTQPSRAPRRMSA